MSLIRIASRKNEIVEEWERVKTIFIERIESRDSPQRHREHVGCTED
jgi:hypothetical protein